MGSDDGGFYSKIHVTENCAPYSLFDIDERVNKLLRGRVVGGRRRGLFVGHPLCLVERVCHGIFDELRLRRGGRSNIRIATAHTGWPEAAADRLLLGLGRGTGGQVGREVPARGAVRVRRLESFGVPY